MQLTRDDLLFPTEDEKSQIDCIRSAPPDRRAWLIADARNSREKTLSGVLDASPWWTRQLQLIDPLLRLRWDSIRYCWTVDRLNKVDKCFTTVLNWRTFEDGPLALSPNLLGLIRASDLQRTTPAEHLARKRAEALAIQARNSRIAQSRVDAAFDQLSRDRVQQFFEVERALATGDTLIAHGGDLAYLERRREGLRKMLRREELLVNAKPATTVYGGSP